MIKRVNSQPFHVFRSSLYLRFAPSEVNN